LLLVKQKDSNIYSLVYLIFRHQCLFDFMRSLWVPGCEKEKLEHTNGVTRSRKSEKIANKMAKGKKDKQ
jgi:hypothetical protein